MEKILNYLWLVVAFLIMHPLTGYSDDYSQTVDFNENQGYSYNINWQHSLSQLPANSSIQSASLIIRAQVWYWGTNIYSQNIDIMVSDTNVFSLPQSRICQLNPSTNPNPSSFYTVTCPLPATFFDYITNNGQIYVGINTYNGTYYLDYSTLNVSTSSVQKYSLSVTVNPITSGSVTLNPSGSTFNAGQIVTLLAANNSGYVFDHWTGAVSDTQKTSATVIMNSDQSVVAYFASDRDSDGVKDSIDGCPDDPNKIEPGGCGCGCVETQGQGLLTWLYLLLSK